MIKGCNISECYKLVLPLMCGCKFKIGLCTGSHSTHYKDRVLRSLKEVNRDAYLSLCCNVFPQVPFNWMDVLVDVICAAPRRSCAAAHSYATGVGFGPT